MKYLIINSLLVASSILGIAGTASAERLVTAVTDTNGTAYQVDLDNRSEYQTDSGWRHVDFWLSTVGDVKKHPATASCAPYQVQSYITTSNGYPMAVDILKEQWLEISLGLLAIIRYSVEVQVISGHNALQKTLPHLSINS